MRHLFHFNVCLSDRRLLGTREVTRATLRTVLARLASGDTLQAILADFPSLTLDDARAAIAFAAASAEEDLPTPAVPRVTLDENPPLRVAIALRARSHDVQTVGEEGLTGRADEDIWQASQREGRILITQDLDFPTVANFNLGSHHGIVLIRLRSPSRENLIARVNKLFDTEDVSGWGGCFVVVTERKIGIRRPDPSRN